MIKNRTVRFSHRFPENVGRDTLYEVVRVEDEGGKQIIINTCVRPNLLIIYFILIVAFCSGRRRRTVSHNETRTSSAVAWYTRARVCVCAGESSKDTPGTPRCACASERRCRRCRFIDGRCQGLTASPPPGIFRQSGRPSKDFVLFNVTLPLPYTYILLCTRGL